MPLRLIAGFDQRWRDTPVKTAAACSRSLALYSSLFPSLPLPLCSSIHPLFIPVHLSFAPTSLYLFCLSSSVPSWKKTRVRPQGSERPSCFPATTPRCLLSHARTGQLARSASWHTREGGTINKHTKECTCICTLAATPINDTKADPDSNTNTHIGCAVQADVSAAI